MPDKLQATYFHQLTQGCGTDSCDNAFCASNKSFALASASENERRRLAVTLAEQGTVHLCQKYHQASLQINVSQVQKDLPEFSYQTFTQITDPELQVRLVFRTFSKLSRIQAAFGDLNFSDSDNFGVFCKQLDISLVGCAQTAIATCLDAASVRVDMKGDELAVKPDNVFSLLIILQFIINTQFNYDLLEKLSKLYDGAVVSDEHMCSVIRLMLTKNVVGLMHYVQCLNTPLTPGNLQLIQATQSSHEAVQKHINVVQQAITDRIDYIVKNGQVLPDGSTQLGVALNIDQPLQKLVSFLDMFHKLYVKDYKMRLTNWYNKSVNHFLEIKEDFPHFKAKEGFSFCNYPWILEVSTKSDILKVESMVQMRHELQDSFFRAMFVGVNSPYLVIEVRRDHLVRDAMYQLSPDRRQDLKKQLKVQFSGEDGLDEGGLQKEFFQLITRELFNADYGIFEIYDSSMLYWFTKQIDQNSQDEQKLVGRLFGLAIYNSIILDVQFPKALYKKLCGEKVTLEDLKQLDPELGRSLEQLLDYSGNDVEEIFSRTFQIDYTSNGEVLQHDLIENGAQIPLTNANRREFVDLYVDFMLNKSVKSAFDSFKQGFQDVVAGTTIQLFDYNELELLICGSLDLDFNVLKEHCAYDGGFEASQQLMQWFWEVVLSYDDTQKKQLLSFATGTSRIPISGIAKLPFTITKNGPDSERLPSSHTCFNVLLMPEYTSKEKLQQKLATALQNAEGFGMI